jgi:hypothetical protein
VGLKSLKSPNLTNGYPNKNKNNKNKNNKNNKVKSKPLELRSRVKNIFFYYFVMIYHCTVCCCVGGFVAHFLQADPNLDAESR